MTQNDDISVISFANPNSGRVLTKNSRSTSGNQLPIGGDTGQVLQKNSNLDGDTSWQTITSSTISPSTDKNFVTDAELTVLESITENGLDGGGA